MNLVFANLLQLEYDNVEGMILLSELSRRRIRSIQKLIRVGRNEVVMVMRIDKEKGMLLCAGLPGSWLVLKTWASLCSCILRRHPRTRTQSRPILQTCTIFNVFNTNNRIH